MCAIFSETERERETFHPRSLSLSHVQVRSPPLGLPFSYPSRFSPLDVTYDGREREEIRYLASLLPFPPSLLSFWIHDVTENSVCVYVCMRVDGWIKPTHFRLEVYPEDIQTCSRVISRIAAREKPR